MVEIKTEHAAIAIATGIVAGAALVLLGPFPEGYSLLIGVIVLTVVISVFAGISYLIPR